MSIVLNPFTGQFDIAGTGGGGGSPTIGQPVVGADPNSVLISDSSSKLADIPLSTGQLVIGRTSNTPIAATLTGTVNQIIITNSSGSITLSLPQDIAITSTPHFANLNLSPSGALDVTTAGTLAIGTGNATIINIGNSGATVNVQGDTFYQNVTNLNVANKIINLNTNGSAGSASNTGIDVEENSIVTAYINTSADRNSWQFKAPAQTGVVTISPGASGFVINQGSHDPITFTAVGSTPNANGASLSSQAITLQPANGTNPGLLTAIAQTIGGSKTFNSSISAANLSGTNTGDVTLATVGSTPNTNAATLVGQVLNLELADATFPGLMSSSEFIAITGGTPNSFAGYNSSGVLESIPGWLFNNGTGGANVSVTADPLTISTTLQNFASDFSPSANSAHDESGYSFLTTFDNVNSGFDNAATVTGVSVGQVMSGNGTLDAQRALIVDQHSGNGASTGIVPFQSGLEIYSEVTGGTTVVDAVGVTLQYNQNGTSTGNYNGINASTNNQAIGGNLTGISFVANTAVTGGSTLLQLVQNGTVGTNLNVISSDSGGATTSDYLFIDASNSGTIGQNHFAFNYNNQNTGSVANDFEGISLTNNATVGNFFTGSQVVNHGVITKGLNGYSIDNDGNVGDGSGVGLIGFNVNLSGGSMAGNISGFNLFNTMPITTNDGFSGVNINNQGAGYRYAGMYSNNSSNQTEEIRGFSHNSTGNSRTSTGLDITMNGTVTDDANGIRLNMLGSATNVNALSINLSGITSPNQKSGLNIDDGSLNVDSNLDTSLITPGGEFQLNDLGGTLTVAAGFPLTGQFGFMNNLGSSFIFNDNVAPDGALGSESLGLSVNGFINQIEVAAGKTADTINYMIAGGGIAGGSGTVTNMSLFRALGFLPEGGTLAITNLYGFKADTFLGVSGATNEWGFWGGSTTSNNWFAKNLIIGGTTGLPTLGGVGLELGPSRSLRINDFITDGVLLNNSTGDITSFQGTTSGDVLTWNGTNWTATAGASGSVTSVSVVSANGFSGTVATSTTTPAITISTSITGILQGNGTAISAANTTGSGNVVLATAPTLSNPIVGTQTQGDTSTKAASTAYVDTAVANAVSGINPAVAVSAATTSAGDTSGFTYNNGVSGVGAIFTGSTNTPIVIDGFTFTALGQRLLIKNDTQSPSGAFNGIYYVTQVQTSILPPILTRALDYNQPSDINNTGAIPVINGTLNGTTSWVQTANITTVGTSALVFVQFTKNPNSYGTVTSVGMTVPTFLSVSGSPVTTSGTLGVTLSGTALPAANGGTGVNSVTVIPAATSFAGWDASKNFSANNFIPGFTSTLTAAGTTTLSLTSTYNNVFTGTTTQTCKLPVVSTIANSYSYQIINLSTGVVTVQSSGSNVLQAMASNTVLIATVTNATAGTGTASWSWTYQTLSGGSSAIPTITAWTPYTPTIIGFGTPTSVDFMFRRIGDSYEIAGSFISDTPTAVAGSIGIPGGNTIDGTKLISGRSSGVYYNQNSVGRNAKGGPILASPNQAEVNFGDLNTFSPAVSSTVLTAQNGTSLAVAGDVISIDGITIPITGFTVTN